MRGLFMTQPPTNHRRSEKEIFFEAIERATAEQRVAYLDKACGDDSLLRRRVEDLLARHFQQSSFMKQPAVDGSPTADYPASISEDIDTTLDRYKLLEKLGEGGFGSVY